MSYIVYRQLPDLPHRQYVRRIVNSKWILWHRDASIAERMSSNDAHTIAHILRQRATGWDGHQAMTEPAGEYGVQEVTP